MTKAAHHTVYIAKNHLAPLQEVKRWFDDALGRSDPPPTDAALAKLARDLQIIVNQQNNAELEGRGAVPSRKLKDVSLPDERQKRARRVVAAANGIAKAVASAFAALDDLENFAGGYRWIQGDRTFTLQDAREILVDIQDKLWSIRGLMVVECPPPISRGRRPQRWHEPGRRIAEAIQIAMRNISYKGSLRATDEHGVIAIVGAHAISWAYTKPIGPKGFATGMQARDRRKKVTSLSYDERFPRAARIKLPGQPGQ